MLNEHALTYQGRLSTVDLEYLAVKANRLGSKGGKIMRVFQEEDEEGIHIYYEVIGLKYEQKRSP